MDLPSPITRPYYSQTQYIKTSVRIRISAPSPLSLPASQGKWNISTPHPPPTPLLSAAFFPRSSPHCRRVYRKEIVIVTHWFWQWGKDKLS
ncbi:hypothetical protein ES319_D11G201000v1 [Gossypium barbadense]|uniref:Uncharacterized protein n=3 Tax=Gossypium TaxID=3633 RepID=A0A0D2SNF2_GOSRA|nr:hypothetical protein ES319_D11G201000v1 [Gossypium barbadense]KJB43491.1 hypothetical protein B456_007G203000 [Gossypium raimondii]TYG45895.1 hypothetical protein ES288_D11G212300v1 [Gossypium darwinii]